MTTIIGPGLTTVDFVKLRDELEQNNLNLLQTYNVTQYKPIVGLSQFCNGWTSKHTSLVLELYNARAKPGEKVTYNTILEHRDRAPDSLFNEGKLISSSYENRKLEKGKGFVSIDMKEREKKDHEINDNKPLSSAPLSLNQLNQPNLPNNINISHREGNDQERHDQERHDQERRDQERHDRAIKYQQFSNNSKRSDLASVQTFPYLENSNQSFDFQKCGWDRRGVSESCPVVSSLHMNRSSDQLSNGLTATSSFDGYNNSYLPNGSSFSDSSTISSLSSLSNAPGLSHYSVNQTNDSNTGTHLSGRVNDSRSFVTHHQSVNDSDFNVQQILQESSSTKKSSDSDSDNYEINLLKATIASMKDSVTRANTKMFHLDDKMKHLESQNSEQNFIINDLKRQNHVITHENGKLQEEKKSLIIKCDNLEFELSRIEADNSEFQQQCTCNFQTSTRTIDVSQINGATDNVKISELDRKVAELDHKIAELARKAANQDLINFGQNRINVCNDEHIRETNEHLKTLFGYMKNINIKINNILHNDSLGQSVINSPTSNSVASFVDSSTLTGQTSNVEPTTGQTSNVEPIGID